MRTRFNLMNTTGKMRVIPTGAQHSFVDESFAAVISPVLPRKFHTLCTFCARDKSVV